MSNWGDVNFKELEDLQKKLNEFEKNERQRFYEEACKEVAARMLAKVIKRTPVGVYDDRTGGTLRRGWTAGEKLSAVRFANNLQVKREGDAYVIDIINPVEYASYVEYGHRTRNHKGWVTGRFMMTISENEINAQLPSIIEKKMKKFFAEEFKI